MTQCVICKRTLKNPVSIAAGMGPICQLKSSRRTGDGEAYGTIATLPFDFTTMNIVCLRTDYSADGRGKVQCNISSNFSLKKSPTGFEWGYSGSGPSALAMEILYFFTHNQSIAQGYFVEFREEFIAHMPMEGGTISGTAIYDWIDEHVTMEEPT